MATQAEIPSQLGKTAVVTGSTGGLGYEMVLALAKAGAEIILTGRDDRKGQSALEKVSREVVGARIRYERLDLASLASIADFAQRMQVRQSLDLLSSPTASVKNNREPAAFAFRGRIPLNSRHMLAS
jgi:NAD(P)-dependent dehydrogenase (short-subunit alcohol dehydrogenase family)